MNAFHRNLMEKPNSSQILELLEAMEEVFIHFVCLSVHL